MFPLHRRPIQVTAFPPLQTVCARGVFVGASLLLVLSSWAQTTPGIPEEHGPGLGKVTFKESELMTPAAILKPPADHLGFGAATYYKGWMMIPHIIDHDIHAGWAFYDFSNPRNPKLIFEKRDAETDIMREQLGYGYAIVKNRVQVAAASYKGVMLYDFTDPHKITVLSTLDLPGCDQKEYDRTIFWLHYQHPYIYGAGVSLGLFVVDASDPKNMKLVKHMAMDQAGGFRVGQVTAVGNILVGTDVVSPAGTGYGLYDISDPVNPKVLDVQKKNSGYASFVNGNKIYSIADRVYEYDISTQKSMRYVRESDVGGTLGAYMSVQDDKVFGGFSSNIAELDSGTLKVVRKAASKIPGNDEDWSVAIGNVLFAADDHAKGSAIYPHQMQPDNVGPQVTMMSPKPGIVGQAITSRIGLTFSDAIDVMTLSAASIQIHEVGGAPGPLAGTYSYQAQVVNFTPDQPLKADATYEVSVGIGGVRDWSQNAVTTPFSARFSTGAAIDLTTPVITTSIANGKRSLIWGASRSVPDINALGRVQTLPSGLGLRFYRPWLTATP